MTKLKYFILFVVSLVCINNMLAQIPVNDPSWTLQPSTAYGGTDEFNASLDTTNKWFPHYPWGTYKGQAEMDYPSNLIDTGTTLKIKADTLYPPVRKFNDIFHVGPPDDSVTVVYQGGNLQSRRDSVGNELYKFGYLEIYAKMPQDSIYPIWPAFWLWSAACTPLFYNEIDILENSCGDTYYGNVMGTNWHIFDWGDCDSNGTTENGLQIFNLPFHLHDAFHKYAIEWGPDRIIYYLDDVPVRTHYDATGVTVPQQAMSVILNLAIDTYNAWLPADWNVFPHLNLTPTSYPQYFEIDYLRYYKLKASSATCGTDLTICTPTINYSGREVEKTIKTGGTCSPTFNGTTTATSYTLRATDYVLIDEGTSVNPSGTGYFAIEIMACPN